MSSILVGRYRLDAKIGGGGMGEVWSAHDNVLDRVVAIKVIRTHLADDPKIRERLRTEAQLAGSLHHPGIVDVFDYGEHTDENGQTVPFLVMPLIEGAPLSDILAVRTTLTAGETMAVVCEVAEALQSAHQAGIVHRDLKPGNVLVTRSGRVMLADFGIARATAGASVTQAGTLLGTVDYLSPEQAAGEPAGPSSDLYALGVVAYACLVGATPFRRDTDIATALAHIQAPVPDLPPEVPRDAAELVQRLLAKTPDERPATAADVALAADALATDVPAPVRPRAEGDDEGTMPDGALLAPTGPGKRRAAAPAKPPRRRWPWAVLALVLLVAGAGAVWALTRGPAEVLVPDVTGDTSIVAVQEIAEAGLEVETQEVDAEGAKAGTVVEQTPAPGSTVEEGTVVRLSIASGAVAIPVDDLMGESYDDAAKILTDLGLVPTRVDQLSDEDVGTVIDVAPDTTAQPGAIVVLTVAQAPVPTPDDDGDDDSDRGNDDGNGNNGSGQGQDGADADGDDPTQPTEPTPSTGVDGSDVSGVDTDALNRLRGNGLRGGR